MKPSPQIWHYVVDIKSTMKILSIVVAFLENMKFKRKISNVFCPAIFLHGVVS